MLPVSAWGMCLCGAGGAYGRDALSRGTSTDAVPPCFWMPQGCPCVQLGSGAAVVSAGVCEGGRRLWRHLWERCRVPERGPRVVRAERLASVARRQPPQPLEPPSTPCDPGKLRLMEDAADWQPRTGTSQSRSFLKLARLTGTDGRKFPQGRRCLAVPDLVW